MLSPSALALPLVLFLTPLLTVQAHAQTPVPVVTPQPRSPPRPLLDPTQLGARLSALIERSGLGAGMGAVVADASTAQRLYTLNPDVPRNPASNMKVLTAATALIELGAEHRLRTSVLGAPEASGRVPVLVLRGEGDPSLTFEDLLGLARRLQEAGVREVERIIIDGSYFDAAYLPPAFEQQPKEIAPFRAAVAAVSVDRNAYTLRVVPGPSVDAPAQVMLRCSDYFDLHAELKTTPGGAPTVIAEQIPAGDRLTLRLAGGVPLGVRGVSYERRVETPLAYAGHCMRAALRTHAIGGALEVQIGKADQALPVLGTHESQPLSVLLQRVGKYSDNFVAEMLLKVVGAVHARVPGSTRAGLARSEALLAKLGVPATGVSLVNGSGLFQGGSLSPAALTAVLVHAYRDPALRPEYLGQLAIAGKDGTLATRLTDLAPARVVRAKTGTLDDVVALSGYVLGPSSERTLAFSFLVTGVSGRQRAARDLLDALVRALVASLYA